MDLRKIKKLIDLLEESNLAEIEIKEGEESVRLARVPSRLRLGPCRTSSFAIGSGCGERAAVCAMPAMLSRSPKFPMF